MQESQRRINAIKQVQEGRSKEKCGKALLMQCYEIISEQKEHIIKIQKDNIIKEKLIKKIKKKNKKQNQYSSQKEQEQEEEKYIEKLLQLLSQQREINKKLNEKNSQYLSQIDKILSQLAFSKQRISQLELINSKLSSQICQNLRQISEQKQNYQRRIQKILAELKKNIQQDISKSKKKRSNIILSRAQEESQLFQDTEIQQKESDYQFFTPNKRIYNNFSSYKQAHEKSLKTNDTQIKRRLQNTPYKNFFSKQLSSNKGQILQQQTFQKDQLLAEQKEKKKEKMLQNIDDVQYLTGSEDSFHSNSQSPPSQSLLTNTKNKISIHEVIKRYQRQQEQKVYFQEEGKRKGEKNIKIQQILQDLTMKIKKFQVKCL